MYDLFFSLNNPIFIVILFFCFLLTLLYVVILKFTIPNEQRHALEKKDLEIQNERNLALFTSLNPSPVFRFQANGKITKCNDAARKLAADGTPDGKDIREIIRELEQTDISALIARGESLQIESAIQKRQFSVRVHGVPESRFAHAYCYDLTERKEYEEKLIQTQGMLRELASHLQDVEESFRSDMAMELHDNICQTLLSIKLNASLLDSERASDTEWKNRLDGLLTSIDNIISETRSLSYHLKPPLLGDFGLVPAIHNLLNQILSKSDIRGDFRTYGMSKRLSPKLEIYLYRILQELLNNILKHSEAGSFSIQLFKNEIKNTVKLHVTDDGRGFEYADTYPAMGLGLLNIRERVKRFNGELILETGRDRGTEIIIEIPLTENE